MLDKIKKFFKKYRKIIAVLILAVVFIFFIKVLYENFSELPFYNWEINYWSLAVSYVFLSMYFIGNVLIWRLIVKKMYNDIDKGYFLRFFKIYFLPYLGKYVPGKIVSFFGRVYLSEKFGVSKFSAAVSIIWEQVFSLLAAALLFLLSLFFWKSVIPPDYAYLIILSLVLFFVVLNSPLYNKAIYFALKKIGKGDYKFKINLSRFTSLKFIIFYVFLWAVFGVSFYFFVNSIYGISWEYFFLILGIYPASWALGTLSFLTPGGIGVTEGVLVALLSIYFPLPVAIIISVSSRIWLSLGEAVCFGLAALIKEK